FTYTTLFRSRHDFKFLVTGDWPVGRIRTAWAPSTRRIHTAVEHMIAQAWQRAIDGGVKLFDGPMCRLESWTENGEMLNLVLSKTSYKPFFGTNLTNARVADEYGPEVLANPVGLSCALVTSDGFLALGRRNAQVAYY